MRTVIVLAASLWMVGCSTSPRVSSGNLGPSKYMIASPPQWNGDLLILAHGYTPDSAPLSAEFNPSDPPFKGLLDEGWVVASTSYRRNGIIVRDACDDIDALRTYVAGRFGHPTRTFLMGWSMGGAVAAMIAETRGSDFQGIVAVGAALDLQDAANPYRLTHRPLVPVLFLTNQNELDGPSRYVRQVQASGKPAAVWAVKRDGHCNVNGPEMRAAIDALIVCARTGRLEARADATVSPPSRPSTTVFKDGKAYVKVMRVGHGYQNIYAEFTEADFARLGIAKGSHFVVGRAGTTFNVFFGSQYGDVPVGQWVAFFNADGILIIARNSDIAGRELGCVAGEEIYIYPEEPNRR